VVREINGIEKDSELIATNSRHNFLRSESPMDKPVFDPELIRRLAECVDDVTLKALGPKLSREVCQAHGHVDHARGKHVVPLKDEIWINEGDRG
jgi:hypothetical protein